jgi:formiminotetrahydrofolate cyclodeaminase
MAYVDLTVRDFLEAVGERTPAPASGAATAVTGALAAALAELAARFADDEEAFGSARELRDRLTALADEDARAYAEFMETRSDEARARTIEVPLAMAEAALEVVRIAEEVERQLDAAVAGDAAAAATLARAAVRSAAELVVVNVRGDERDARLVRARKLSAEAERPSQGGR